ncbi:NADPH-dependent F420 reductase [Rhizorhapis suberifaciens]|uniref:Pyrroline-5-carboxylate reductase catalytic N-terminal domain-containing protein n=1 Tax=Rhizorhapis suberifaciens TaxID=13656 RepID=A0A840HZZ9_9SPHN|nr:NAD(P)-binding domain-containing protein [Rhizorhapis suberifaciens]MBB4643034.1 hypothetical protein [Rhizorhapis suberifaciens]
MKIGIIGTGAIGSTLIRKLAASGHGLKIANADGPETLRDLAEETGAKAVTTEDAVKDVDVVVLSIPTIGYFDLKTLFNDVPSDVIVVDTSNYYPFRDNSIPELEQGKPESLWVSEQIGRPVIKTWNAGLAYTLAERGKPAGAPGRLALPVAGDDAKAKATVMELVSATGFDPLDSGSLADSWRQQPGTPAYCTELTLDELKVALAAANKERAPHNRETLIKEFMARYEELSHDDTIAMNRAGTA